MTFPGATGQHFSLLRSLAEFTSLTLTAAGPTLGNRAHRLFLFFSFFFTSMHLEQFYLARLEIFKMGGEGDICSTVE